MKNMNYAFALLCIGATVNATSLLEEAVLKSDVALVKQLIAELPLKGLLDKEKNTIEVNKILERSYQVSLDVIQELKDTTEVWNSWIDIVMVGVGVLEGVPFLLEGVYREDVLWGGAGALMCCVGVLGYQCKAQQHKFEAPYKIKHLLEDAIDPGMNTLKESVRS